MDARARDLIFCQTGDGKVPLVEWLATLDRPMRSRILLRIDRLEDGNFGDVKPVGEGVSELRLDFGPGYRIYFGQRGRTVYLITGGDKKTQSRDIEGALRFWRGYE